MTNSHGEEFHGTRRSVQEKICGIAIPTEQVQHARLNDKTEMIGIENCMKLTNEKEWIEVKNKPKKVRFVNKINLVRPSNLAGLIEFGKIDRKSNLK
jgi:hypothetical protein